jgi:hypothetical protein
VPTPFVSLRGAVLAVRRDSTVERPVRLRPSRPPGLSTLLGVTKRRELIVPAVIVGLLLIALAVLYWAEPAKSLPSFIPGHEAGSGHHHVKHGIAAFLLGLACLVFAWFQTGGDRTRTAA